MAINRKTRIWIDVYSASVGRGDDRTTAKLNAANAVIDYENSLLGAGGVDEIEHLWGQTYVRIMYNGGTRVQSRDAANHPITDFIEAYEA